MTGNVRQGNRDEVMTLPETAAYLKVPPKTLYDWRLRNKGPRASKVGKHLRYRLSDIQRWLDDQAGGAAA